MIIFTNKMDRIESLNFGDSDCLYIDLEIRILNMPFIS